MVFTKNIDKTAEFFYKALDLRSGYRGEYSYPGRCLYSEDKLLIHLVAKPKFGQKMQVEFSMNECSDSKGPVNHVAIEGDNYIRLTTRLDKYRINYSERKVTLLRQHQVLIYGPYNLVVEVIFTEDKSPMKSAPNVLINESR